MGAQQSQTFGYDVGVESKGGFSDAPIWTLHVGFRKVHSTQRDKICTELNEIR